MRTALLPLAAVASSLVGVAQDDDGAPRWLKGNLHTHSLWSDGNDFPEMIVGWYRDRDYHFVGLSDHNVLADHERWIETDLVTRRGGRRGFARYRERFGDWVETRRADGGKLEVRLRRIDEYRPLFEAAGEFLVVQMEEISASYGGLPIHLNATNLAETIRPVGGESVRAVIAANVAAVEAQAKRLERPILVHLNHPNFGYAVTAEDLAWAVGERFFEIYNGHPAVEQRGDAAHAGLETLWDVANTLRLVQLGAAPLFGVATDDSHNYHNAAGATPGRGWVQVRSTTLDARGLIDAMERGDFYASSGVELVDVRFDGEELAIDIAPVAGVTYETRFVGTPLAFDPRAVPVVDADGAPPLRATFRYSKDVGKTFGVVAGLAPRYRLTGDELYVRAIVVASAPPENPVWEGQRQQAWTQPVGWRRAPRASTGR